MSLTHRRLDRHAVLTGAAVDLVIFLPLVVGVAILKHNDVATQESWFWVASVVALFVAPTAGGAIAGRQRPDAPLTHGAAAATTAFVVFLVFRLIDGGVRHQLPNPFQMALFLILTAGMGVVGAYLSYRGIAPGSERGDSGA